MGRKRRAQSEAELAEVEDVVAGGFGDPARAVGFLLRPGADEVGGGFGEALARFGGDLGDGSGARQALLRGVVLDLGVLQEAFGGGGEDAGLAEIEAVGDERAGGALHGVLEAPDGLEPECAVAAALSQGGEGGLQAPGDAGDRGDLGQAQLEFQAASGGLGKIVRLVEHKEVVLAEESLALLLARHKGVLDDDGVVRDDHARALRALSGVVVEAVVVRGAQASRADRRGGDLPPGRSTWNDAADLRLDAEDRLAADEIDLVGGVLVHLGEAGVAGAAHEERGAGKIAPLEKGERHGEVGAPVLLGENVRVGRDDGAPSVDDGVGDGGDEAGEGLAESGRGLEGPGRVTFDKVGEEKGELALVRARDVAGPGVEAVEGALDKGFGGRRGFPLRHERGNRGGGDSPRIRLEGARGKPMPSVLLLTKGDGERRHAVALQR